MAGTEREDSSTRPGARRLSLSLLLSFGEGEGDEESEVGPTTRRERRGRSLLVREAWRRVSARVRRPDAMCWRPAFAG